MGKMRIKTADSICGLTGNMWACGFLARGNGQNGASGVSVKCGIAECGK